MKREELVNKNSYRDNQKKKRSSEIDRVLRIYHAYVN